MITSTKVILRYNLKMENAIRESIGIQNGNLVFFMLIVYTERLKQKK